MRHIDFKEPLPASPWRKIAIGTWNRGGDPSTYGVLHLRADLALEYIRKVSAESGERVTISHFFARALAHAFQLHPEINGMIRLGRVYPRTTIDVFFLAAVDKAGNDLSGVTVRSANTKSVIEIAQEMNNATEKLRTRGDVDYSLKKLFRMLPGACTRPLLWLGSFLCYTLNIWFPWFGTPRDPFGSVVVTNVGSLGLDFAFGPLVPFSRCPLILAMSNLEDHAFIENGVVTPGKRLSIGATIDHRVVDGVHMAKICDAIRAVFANPEKHLLRTP